MKFKELLDVMRPGVRLLVSTVNGRFNFDNDDTTFEEPANSIFLPELEVFLNDKGIEVLRGLYGNRRVFKYDPENIIVYVVAKAEEDSIKKWQNLN